MVSDHLIFVLLVFFRLVLESKKQITKGAPSLFTIHSDKRISKEKEKDE
jgi:hypothetical protein